MPLMETKKSRGRPRDVALQERRRTQIVDAAAVMFARDGYRSTDLQRVADALDVAKGTLYRYFKTKEDLFLAAVDRGVDRLHEYITVSVRHVRDPMEKIAGAIRAYLAFFRENPGLVELFIQERAEFRDRGKPTYFRRHDTKLAPWEDLIRGLISGGRLRNIPPRRVTDVMGDVLYGAMFTNHVSVRRKPHEEQANDILDIVFNGIASDTERRLQNK